MSNPSQKVFTDLQFYLWRIRYEPKENWQSEILVTGTNTALNTIREALVSMQEDFRAYGRSTRKFLCNPPEDFDVIRYAREHQAEIEWQIWLILRMEPKIADDARFEQKNKAVTIFLNEKTAQKLLQVLDAQLNPKTQYPHGQKAPGGLFFAPDWLGAE